MMRLRKIGALLMVGCLYVSTVSASQSSAMAEDILMYINQYRARQGLAKLKMNPILSEEAMKHSVDMATHRVAVGHDGFYKRMARLHQRIETAQSGAENVAFNYKTAKIVSDGWIASRGHRHNIVGHYDQTGIGIAYENQGRPYFTKFFLKTAEDAR